MVLLGVIVYFIPWYSFKRMRVIKKRLEMEEEKLDLSGYKLERQDRVAEELKNIKLEENKFKEKIRSLED